MIWSKKKILSLRWFEDGPLRLAQYYKTAYLLGTLRFCDVIDVDLTSQQHHVSSG